jgi:hypothetical protein
MKSYMNSKNLNVSSCLPQRVCLNSSHSVNEILCYNMTVSEEEDKVSSSEFQQRHLTQSRRVACESQWSHATLHAINGLNYETPRYNINAIGLIKVSYSSYRCSPQILHVVPRILNMKFLTYIQPFKEFRLAIAPKIGNFSTLCELV